MDPSGSVLHTVREKEKPYYSEQEDAAVVQPYAAYSPPGNPKVKKNNNNRKTPLSQCFIALLCADILLPFMGHPVHNIRYKEL